MQLSIIIVNWKSVEFTKDCIASIQATARDIDYEIVVVDNASNDDCCRIISEAFPRVITVGSEKNIGFARANNLGVQHSKGKYLLFLNPDTIVLGDALRTMLTRIDSEKRVGAVGCRLLNRDFSLQTSCVQAFPSIANQVLGVEWLRLRFPRLRLWGMQALYMKNAKALVDVDAVSGACMMVLREAFEEAGGFSTEYFMYAEEVDLCYKIHRAGWTVAYVPDAEIVHFGGESSKKQRDVFADIVMRESTFKFMRKFRGRVYAALYRAAILASAAVRLAILSPFLLIPRRDRSDLVRICRKWYKIGAWSLAQERWTTELGG